MPADITAESLLLNDVFIEYCLAPNAQNTIKWEKMVRDNNIPAQVIEQAKGMLTMLTPAIDNVEIEQEVLRLGEIIHEREVKRKKIISRLSVFAGLALAISTVAFFTLQRGPRKKETVLASTYHTATGEQKRITLPDGTIVIMNSNTDITLGKTYNTSDRKVFLHGNAFFKVAKNTSKPFSVISDEFSTTALGTSFYVNANAAEDFSVKLLEGKVRVNSGKIDSPAYLEPGQELKCPKAQTLFIKQHYDTSYLNKWVSGKIVFRKTPVEEAFAILQQWYGVEIKDARNKRADVAINGTYENVLLEDILKVISFSLHCQYRYEGNKVIIE